MGLTWTGVAALFLALRLMAVTRYDWQTAFAVADTIDINDAFSMMIGTAMADRYISGIALALLLPILIIHEGRKRRHGDPIGASLVGIITVFVFSVAHVLTYHSWWLIATALAVTALLSLSLHERVKGTGRHIATWLVTRVGLVAVALLLVVAATVHTPWAPQERITTVHGTVRGYVLDTPPGFLKVLTVNQRELIVLVTTEVRSRHEA